MVHPTEKRIMEHLLAIGYIKSRDEFLVHPPGGASKKQKKKTASRAKNGKAKKKASSREAEKLRNHFIVPKNFQGFEKRLCVFEPSIQDYVFVPKQYGAITKAHTRVEFCKKCMLTPCFTIENMEELAEKSVELSSKKTLSKLAIGDRMESFVRRRMVKYYGREYAVRTGIPECVLEEIVLLTEEETEADKFESDSSEEDDDGSEDELEFN